MADDVVLPGSGETVAAEEIESRKHQLVKIEFGADGGATLVSDDTPLPVTTNDEVFTIVPTLDTSAYAVGDTLFNATEINDVALATGKPVTLVSLCATGADDQKTGIAMFFFDRSVTFGTINAAPSISDADAAFFVGRVDIVVADWVDLGGVAVANPVFNPILMKPNATDLYVAAITTGTPTHTASGLSIKLGFAR